MEDVEGKWRRRTSRLSSAFVRVGGGGVEGGGTSESEMEGWAA